MCCRAAPAIAAAVCASAGRGRKCIGLLSLIILGAAAEPDGGGEALLAARPSPTGPRPYFVPLPDRRRTGSCTASSSRRARRLEPGLPVAYEARTPPLAAAARDAFACAWIYKARLQLPSLEEPRVIIATPRARTTSSRLCARRRARYCRKSCRPTGPGRRPLPAPPTPSPRSRTGRTRGSTSCPARCSTTGATFARANKSAVQRACACRSTTAGS